MPALAEETRKVREIFDEVFLREYFTNGQNATNAYLKLKPLATSKTASVLGHKILVRVNKTGKYKEIANAMGLSEERVKGRIGEILNQPLKEKYVMPDHILRAAEDGARILGMNAPERHIVATADLTAILDKIEDKKKNELKEGENGHITKE